MQGKEVGIEERVQAEEEVYQEGMGTEEVWEGRGKIGASLGVVVESLW